VEKIRRRVGVARAARRVAAPRPEFRQGGVYALPDGTELVVAAAPGGRYLLYHPLVWAGRAWVVDMPVAYVVTAEGHVFTRAGRPTLWRVEDLTDLRRTAGGGGAWRGRS
jgi:hypothetical protein